MRTFSLLFAAVVSLALVGGCTVGPNYRTPDARMPGGWATLNRTSTQPSIANEQATQIATWWERFGDPKLDELIAAAIEGNLNLAQAKARLQQARALRAVSAGGLWPSVDLSTSYRRSGQDSGISTGSNDRYQLGFDATWEIDVFGGQRRTVEAADARVFSSSADLMDVRISLVAEVAVNYLNLRTSQQRLAISRKNLELQQRSLDLTKRQVAAGFAARLDLAQAEAQIANTQAQIPGLRQSAQQSVLELALLLGKDSSALLAMVDKVEPIPTTPPVVPTGLPAELLRRRPDIRRAEGALWAATANIGVATADLYPRFNLVGSIGTADSKMKGLFNWSNSLWSIGPTISWNVFDAGRIRANIALAEAQNDEAKAFYYQSILIAVRDVESALTAYDFEQERRQRLQASVDANRRAYDLANQLYAQGQVEFVNVLTAQQALLNSEDASAQSEAAVAKNLVALYKALGGGWADSEPNPVVAGSPAEK
ncbi:efflux transporter outer membrane subunit [Humisphaera borealis]|uniref:Efflux transporter outer membrane subunit n=1 Tax=Humisphaera borealis TaxID=2807512 RepID=A0A7M2WSR5_9BACT|nr:efflux transporter outer membrane subunit [Humisphaera borealis]QOV88506.1 efflux transporter outer membrane subunit [Humisphaera borealis]